MKSSADYVIWLILSSPLVLSLIVESANTEIPILVVVPAVLLIWLACTYILFFMLEIIRRLGKLTILLQQLVDANNKEVK